MNLSLQTQICKHITFLHVLKTNLNSMLEPLQNGGRKFSLSWLRGFSLGLDRDPRVFCGTSASRTLVIGPHRKPQNHLVLATVNVYFLSAERRPCSPIIQAVTESEKEPSSQVHTHCSLTHRHLSRGCSPPRMPAQTIPPSCRLHQLSSTRLQNGARLL